MTWHAVKLREVATIDRQQVDPSAIEAGTNYLGLEHIAAGGRILGSQSVDPGELASTKFKFSPQHVLFGKLRPYLAKIATPDFSGICSTDILPIMPGNSLCRNYLAYYMRQPSVVQTASLRATGANLPRLSPKALADIEIPLPPVDEQRRIAAILDKADAIRRKREQALALADDLLKSTFLEMFGDPVTNPKGWPVEELGEWILHSNNGLARRRKTTANEGSVVLRLQDVRANWIDYSNCNRIALEDKERGRFELEAGDLLFVRVNGNPDYVGRCAVFKGYNEPVYHNDHLIRLRFSEKVSSDYLGFLFNLPAGRQLLASAVKTSAGQYSISQDGLKKLRIPLPSSSQQQIFFDFAKKSFRLRDRLARAEEQARELFAALSQRAFKGEL
jgi:type I restriction enzyme S subunit